MGRSRRRCLSRRAAGARGRWVSSAGAPGPMGAQAQYACSRMSSTRLGTLFYNPAKPSGRGREGGRRGSLFVYVYDSTYAAAAARALPAPTTHARLAQSAGVVWSMLRCIACPDDFHVHSHQGHPWNEMVDVVASRASKGLLHVPCPAAGPRILNDIVKSPWVFLNVLPRALWHLRSIFLEVGFSPLFGK